MIGYIRGIVTEKEDDYIIIETNNIGYKVFVGYDNKLKLNEEYKLYIYNHIKAEEYVLYGFETKEQLELFEKIISVKGIGPKMGIKIIMAGSPLELKASIKNEDISYFKKIPKVGEKLARQIILELKNSLKKDSPYIDDDVVAALKSLGYKSLEINNVIKKIDSNLCVEDKIKNCLKILQK